MMPALALPHHFTTTHHPPPSAVSHSHTSTLLSIRLEHPSLETVIVCTMPSSRTVIRSFLFLRYCVSSLILKPCTPTQAPISTGILNQVRACRLDPTLTYWAATYSNVSTTLEAGLGHIRYHDDISFLPSPNLLPPVRPARSNGNV